MERFALVRRMTVRPGVVALAVTTMVLTSAGLAVAATGVIERVSLASDGTQADQGSVGPAISADGRYVAFVSYASNLLPGDTNGAGDVFVRDRETGATERVSVASDGAQANNNAGVPAISADGRYVAFVSYASNLVAEDTNGQSDVFVHDRETGTTERVSVASDGTQSNGLPDFEHLSVSADGRYVAFMSGASNLVAGDTNNSYDVFVRDRVAGTTERVNVASDGAQSIHNYVTGMSMSADGRYVAFTSEASNLVAGDTNGNWDVFVRDRVAGTTERVSVASDGAQGDNGSSGDPAISADGRYVAFGSWASNLAVGDTNGRLTDLYVRDRVAGTTERVGVGEEVFGVKAAISDDGSYVAFHSSASTVVAGDTNGRLDVFVYDRQSGTTERVSEAVGGAQANGVSFFPALSGDGRYVAFQSVASNLVADDTNEQADVFVRDRAVVVDSTPPTLTLPDPVIAEATGTDGTVVTYSVSATDDTDPNPNVVCEPASGATFAVGSTTVSCVATDGSGNTAGGSFTVTVQGAAQQLADLDGLIESYGLPLLIEQTLLDKVSSAQRDLARGRTADAVKRLADLIKKVDQLDAKNQLTDAQAAQLRTDAARIKAALGL